MLIFSTNIIISTLIYNSSMGIKNFILLLKSLKNSVE